LQMEKDDKGSTLIRIGVSGESSFWYRPTRVVPDQRPLNGRRLRNDRIMVMSLWRRFLAHPVNRQHASTYLKNYVDFNFQ